MNDTASRRVVDRLATNGALVIASGLVLVGIDLVHLLRERPLGVHSLTGVVLPVTLSVAVVGLGVWIDRSETAPVVRRSVGSWLVVGQLWMGLVGLGVGAYLATEGTQFLHPGLVVASFASYGALPGGLTGWYDGQRRHQVATLREQRRRLDTYRQAVEHTAHAVVITDPDGIIEYVNPAFEEMTGYEAGEAVGKTPRILKSGEHDEAFYERLWSTILAGDVWENELIDRRKDGDLFTIDQTIAPVVDDEGEIVRFVAVNSDVTERRRDRERLERQNERLALLHRMLRHDIGNDVQLVTAMADRLEGQVRVAGSEDLATLQEHTRNIVTLTENMQHFLSAALNEDPDLHAVPLDDVLATAAARVDAEHEGATIRTPDLPAVSVTADGRLDAVFANLLRTVVEGSSATAPRVEIDVAGEGERVRVTIADDGPGDAIGRRASVFEADAALDEGAGIDQYLVRTLVEQYGGDVGVEETDRRGTVCSVWLPLAGEAPKSLSSSRD